MAGMPLGASKAMGLLGFQDPDTHVTLEDGLDEYYGSRQGLVDGRGVSASAAEFFRCHDAAHVVFGCSTTLPNEAMVKMWSFFGTTAGFGLIRDYAAPESQEIYETLPVADIVRTVFHSVVVVPRVIARARRMSRRWPWSRFDDQLGKPLSEIRRDFGIEILVLP